MSQRLVKDTEIQIILILPLILLRPSVVEKYVKSHHMHSLMFLIATLFYY